MGKVNKKEEFKTPAWTRDMVVRALDDAIEMNVNKWGEDYIYTKWARERKVQTLADYDAGKVVYVGSEWYHEHGMDFEREYYSDGSTKDKCYGYSD